MVSLVARSGMWRQNPPPAISIPRLIASEFLESSGIGNVSFQKWGHLIVIYILVILPKIFVNNPFFFFLVKFLLREKRRRWMSECWRMDWFVFWRFFRGLDLFILKILFKRYSDDWIGKLSRMIAASKYNELLDAKKNHLLSLTLWTLVQWREKSVYGSFERENTRPVQLRNFFPISLMSNPQISDLLRLAFKIRSSRNSGLV